MRTPPPVEVTVVEELGAGLGEQVEQTKRRRGRLPAQADQRRTTRPQLIGRRGQHDRVLADPHLTVTDTEVGPVTVELAQGQCARLATFPGQRDHPAHHRRDASGQPDAQHGRRQLVPVHSHGGPRGPAFGGRPVTGRGGAGQHADRRERQGGQRFAVVQSMCVAGGLGGKAPQCDAGGGQAVEHTHEFGHECRRLGRAARQSTNHARGVEPRPPGRQFRASVGQLGERLVGCHPRRRLSDPIRHRAQENPGRGREPLRGGAAGAKHRVDLLQRDGQRSAASGTAAEQPFDRTPLFNAGWGQSHRPGDRLAKFEPAAHPVEQPGGVLATEQPAQAWLIHRAPYSNRVAVESPVAAGTGRSGTYGTGRCAWTRSRPSQRHGVTSTASMPSRRAS